MKIALISPKGVGMGTNAENKRTAELYKQLSDVDSLKELMSCPNSPLLTIAALATPYFEEVVYIDEEIEEINFTDDYDLVAMSFMTQQASRAYELAIKFRELGVYTICGGMHPTNVPEQTAQYFDTVFIGEGELTFKLFAEDFKSGNPKKFYKNNSVINMKNTVIPRYDLLKIDKYRTIPVQISRGCPHNCVFCASTKVYGAKYRHKDVEQVINEINCIKKLKNKPHIYFTDDNMLVQSDFSINLLKKLQDTGIRWMSHTDVEVAKNRKVLELLYASGCRKLVIGFESIIPNSLKNMEEWKFKRLDFYEEAIKTIQSYGIGVWGTFIVGLDQDDTSVFQRVVDFTLKTHLYGAMISVPTPYPGSVLYDNLDKENRILTKHWGSYTLWNVVVQPKRMTAKELEDGFEYVLKSIYSKEATLERRDYFKKLFAEKRR